MGFNSGFKGLNNYFNFAPIFV